MYYDPMIAKLCTWGPDRASAIENMRVALDSFEVEGIGHNLPFCSAVMDHPKFVSGNITTAFIEEEYPEGFEGVTLDDDALARVASAAAAMNRVAEIRRARISGRIDNHKRKVGKQWVVTLQGRDFPVKIKADLDGSTVKHKKGPSHRVTSDWTPGDSLAALEIDGAPLILKVDKATSGFRLRTRGADLRVHVRTPRQAELAAWILLFLAIFMSLSLMASGGISVDPVLWAILPLFLLSAVVISYHLRGERALLQRLSRGAIVVLPLLLLALIPICAVFVFVGSDIRLWQGLLAGLVVVLGWVSTFLFQEERIAQDRIAQESDLLLSLRAEILNFIWKFQQEDFDQAIANLEKLKKDRRKRLPIHFIPSQAEPVVFRSVASNLPLIDDVALSLSVQFYAQMEDIAQLSRDIQGPEFSTLGNRDFRINLLIKYVEMQKLAITLGLIAIRRIEEVVSGLGMSFSVGCCGILDIETPYRSNLNISTRAAPARPVPSVMI